MSNRRTVDEPLSANRPHAPARANIAKLPDQCLVLLPANRPGDRIGLARVGESGYYAVTEPIETFQGSVDEVEQFIDQKNELDYGVTVAQRKAMEHGSMFGWEVPAADPDHEINQKYEPRYRRNLRELAERGSRS